MSKSKPCFEIFVKKTFRWHLETQENQIESIFKLNFKKSVKFQKKNCKIFVFKYVFLKNSALKCGEYLSLVCNPRTGYNGAHTAIIFLKTLKA